MRDFDDFETQVQCEEVYWQSPNFDEVQNEIESDRQHEIQLLEEQLASSAKQLYKSGMTANQIKGYMELALDEAQNERELFGETPLGEKYDLMDENATEFD